MQIVNHLCRSLLLMRLPSFVMQVPLFQRTRPLQKNYFFLYTWSQSWIPEKCTEGRLSRPKVIHQSYQWMYGLLKVGHETLYCEYKFINSSWCMCCFWQGLPNNAIHSTFNLGMFAHWSLYQFFFLFLKKRVELPNHKWPIFVNYKILWICNLFILVLKELPAI